MFYRVSSSGEAAEHLPNLMTDFYPTEESVNGFPVYRRGKYYMFVTPGGRWMVGSTAGVDSGWLNHPTTPAASTPPVSGWQYYNGTSWHTDSTLKVIATNL